MSIHTNLHKFMCSFETKNDLEFKQLVQTIVFNASEFIFVRKYWSRIFTLKS
jgi:hypothetical protein